MKTLILVVILFLAMATSALAFPTYTSNTQSYFTGNYGNSSYPCNVSDETGNQLFDGDYGGYDWFCRHTVESDADYLARYEQQNGFGYGWVAWYTTPYILFDMGGMFTFNQIGIHGYQLGNVAMPTDIFIQFTNDGVSFGYQNQPTTFSTSNTYDNAFWATANFDTFQARFVRISMGSLGTSFWLDEISINGMDGAEFAAVPEPSSLLALVGGLSTLGFLKRRKGI